MLMRIKTIKKDCAKNCKSHKGHEEEVERTKKANGAVERVYVEQKQKKKGLETFP